MKRYIQTILVLFLLIASAPILSSYTGTEKESIESKSIKFPYKQAGLTDRQAAAHLLSRFTYGATPGQIDEVVKMGLEKWFEKQLEANQADDSLKANLSQYEALTKSNKEIFNTYLNGGLIRNRAIRAGLIPQDSTGKLEYKERKELVDSFMKANGYKPEGDLIRQFVNQKIVRAVYTNNQLQEVLASFWFNHFNVSLTKNECIRFVPCYERDVIRPNSLGKFSELLLATSKSPAMLTYLDNFRSVASDNNNVNSEAGAKRLRELYAQQQRLGLLGDTGAKAKEIAGKIKGFKNSQGLNENYAREIMELHTLGVDGGYTQTDVTNAAKVLTGWTIYPMNDEYGGAQIKKMIEKVGEDKLKEQGFVHDGDFMFAVNKHDKTEKVVLGNTFPAKGGVEEGLKLIDMLAHHKSTAHFICKKLAARFVSDNPPASLIDKMTQTFLDKDGDIKKVLLTMVNAPEFWSKQALREKIKSPFELTISTVRALNAKVAQPYQLANWINKMGERIYYYQAPTGFPDRAQYWINSGSLLNRMNFGLALASKRIPGVTFDLTALNNNHEPESAEAALRIYCKLLMPERNVDETVKRLIPLINDPQIHNKIDAAATKTDASAATPPPASMTDDNMMMTSNNGDSKKSKEVLKEKVNRKKASDYTITQLQANAGTNTMLSQVTGIIIGSPEFQRR